VKRLLWLIAAIQIALATRVFARMARTMGGQCIENGKPSQATVGSVAVIVPVLDENLRLGPCLEGLRQQGCIVREIVVVDGGSIDGTQATVRASEHRDGRIRLVDAAPVPDGLNGKAHGLSVGAEAVALDADWLLTIDADVRLQPGAVEAVVQHASRSNLKALSVATTQRIDGRLLSLLHPAMLTTLVYRFGIPGQIYSTTAGVQANGQCFLVRRDLLERAGGFANVLGSIAEDVTLARRIVELGEPVGFFEAGDLVEVEMHANGLDAWRNWPRSLALRDRYATWQSDLGLTEVLFVQAAPLYLLAAGLRRGGLRSPVTQLELGLACARLGVLVGTARAYRSRPWTYWLSPLADLPVALEIIRRSRQKTHIWRGRTVTAGDTR
jgi:dolichol-phosphate mannosyltransferase